MEFWVENLTRSGIKEALVRSAGISPLRRADILDLLHCPTSMLDPDEMGYKIPYFDLGGNILPDVYNIRLKKWRNPTCGRLFSRRRRKTDQILKTSRVPE